MNPIEQITAIVIITHNRDYDNKACALSSISLSNLDITSGGCVKFLKHSLPPDLRT